MKRFDGRWIHWRCVGQTRFWTNGFHRRLYEYMECDGEDRHDRKSIRGRIPTRHRVSGRRSPAPGWCRRFRRPGRRLGPRLEISRYRTALIRGDLSSPSRIAMGDGLLDSGRLLMDHGCGGGATSPGCELKALTAPAGIRSTLRRVSGAVPPWLNLGYIVNLIEYAAERCDVVRRASWLAVDVLVVSARLVDERPTAMVPALATESPPYCATSKCSSSSRSFVLGLTGRWTARGSPGRPGCSRTLAN